jgi:hypothetical protein
MQEPSFLEEDMRKEQIGFESLCTFLLLFGGKLVSFLFENM